MDQIIILLIILQAIIAQIGYYEMSKDIKQRRKDIERFLEFTFLTPLFVYSFKIAATFPHMNFGDLNTFITFMLISVILNLLAGIPVEFMKKMFIKKSQW